MYSAFRPYTDDADDLLQALCLQQIALVSFGGLLEKSEIAKNEGYDDSELYQALAALVTLVPMVLGATMILSHVLRAIHDLGGISKVEFHKWRAVQLCAPCVKPILPAVTWTAALLSSAQSWASPPPKVDMRQYSMSELLELERAMMKRKAVLIRTQQDEIWRRRNQRMNSAMNTPTVTADGRRICADCGLTQAWLLLDDESKEWFCADCLKRYYGYGSWMSHVIAESEHPQTTPDMSVGPCTFLDSVPSTLAVSARTTAARAAAGAASFARQTVEVTEEFLFQNEMQGLASIRAWVRNIEREVLPASTAPAMYAASPPTAHRRPLIPASSAADAVRKPPIKFGAQQRELLRAPATEEEHDHDSAIALRSWDEPHVAMARRQAPPTSEVPNVWSQRPRSMHTYATIGPPAIPLAQPGL